MAQDASLKRYTLMVAAMASFLTPFMGSAINLAIPSIGDEFNSDALLLSWVATSYILASAAFLVPFGRIADIFGRKKIFILGIFAFALSSALCGFARSVEELIAYRVLQGIGSAMIFGTAMAILTSVFPPQERGKVLGINVASVYIGLSLGPVLGGALNHNFGWQFIFYFTTLIAVVALLFTITRLKGEWAGARGEKFDFWGALFYVVGLVALMYGISTVTESVWAKYLAAFGVIIMVIFIIYELKINQPVLNLKLFSKNTVFTFSNLAALINYSATFGVTFLLSLYLQTVMGFDSQTAGIILLSQPILMALLSPFAGNLSDKVQPRIVASWGMAMTTLALLIFCFLSVNTPLWLIITNLAVLGSGFALFSSPNTNAVMGSVEKRSYGVASSILGTMRLTGQTVSMAIVTLLLAIYIGNIELSEASPDLLMKGFRMSMIIFTIICFGGIFASLARGSIGERDKA
ncbi:MFS transporter [Desulfolucanica intricata]|uniref:MFS transporter n=1 Tax=Desulfolucanica intricata TaxID=1285191 RepID=UPI00082DB186|nr:MFS transporter [Desulfolucanica intricata]